MSLFDITLYLWGLVIADSHSLNAQVVYQQHGVAVQTLKCCLGVSFLRLLRREDIESSGFVDRLGATLHAEFVVDSAVMSLDRIQGEEKPLANLAIRESLGNEL